MHEVTEVGMLARKDVLCQSLISVACLQVLLMLGIIILLTVSGIGLISVITMFRIYQTFSWMKDLGVVWTRFFNLRSELPSLLLFVLILIQPPTLKTVLLVTVVGSRGFAVHNGLSSSHVPAVLRRY